MVTPIFKNGVRSDFKNYRQISVISVVAKIFEKVIYEQVYEYFIENGLLSNHAISRDFDLYILQ